MTNPNRQASVGWMASALCAEVATDLFFPEKGSSPRPAQRICAECPVRLRCLRYALDHDEQYGVWGGLTGHERRQLKRGAA